MQSLWHSLVTWWPYGDQSLFMFVTYMSYLPLPAVADSLSLLNHFFPSNAFARLIARWKIQPGAEPSTRLVKEAVVRVLVSRLVIGPLFSWFVIFPLAVRLGMSIRGPLPSLFTFTWQLLFCWAWNDFFFYWAHRTMHAVPWLYTNVHAQHHRFLVPITLGSEFAHPIEAIFSNIIPTIGGAVVLGSHVTVLCAFLFLRIWETLDAHSGYAFPWSPFYLLDGWITLGPVAHDWHHSHNKGMYGVGRFLDKLFGTDQVFLADLAKQSEHQKTQ